MKITLYEQSDDRVVLLGLICSKEVLSSLAPLWDKGGLLRGQYFNTIANLCFDYYKKYGDAPRDAIDNLVSHWGQYRGGRTKEDIEAVERILDELRDRYSCTADINSGPIIDVAARVFNHTKRKKLLEQLQSSLDDSEDDKFEDLLREHRRVPVGRNAVIDVFHDREALQDVFANPVESIVNYPGDLGRFFGRSLCRGGFVAFAAPEKRGKSWQLMDVVYRAIMNRKKVILFEAGDLTQKDTIERISIRTSRNPRFACTLDIPVSLSRQDDKVVVETQEEVFQEDLDFDKAWDSFQEMQRRHLKSDQSFFKLVTFASGTLKVSEIAAICEQEAQNGFSVDVCAVDYADILAGERSYTNTRDKINDVWTDLRGLSTKLHCLLVTCTQGDTDSYSRITMTMENFSDDKRKNAHVTGIIGINQTSTEKEKGLYRLNWLVRRGEAHHNSRFCYVASCLGLARPYVLSMM